LSVDEEDFVPFTGAGVGEETVLSNGPDDQPVIAAAEGAAEVEAFAAAARDAATRPS
jgi:hypothetical protein